jgi:hypothetical protein
MTVTTCQQLIDPALAYTDAWRARKAFRKQFRQEPGVDQVFLKATAAQLDKNVTDSRRNLERTAIILQNDCPNKSKHLSVIGARIESSHYSIREEA